MPASTYQTGATSRNTSSPYEYDEDELIDLQFSEDPTQNYLSLGLTPLSQIDNFPASNDILDTGSEGIGFFPSMPPPVTPMTPMTPLYNVESGIPVDSAFANGRASGGMVMPEAIPADARRAGGRKGKLDLNPMSQNYPVKLETVPEQSGSLVSDNGFDNSRYIGIITNGNADDSSGDSFEATGTESSNLLFPSADGASNLSLHRQGGKRRKSGTRRSTEQLDGSQDNFPHGLMISNRDVDDSDDVDVPVRINRFGSLDPETDGHKIRARAREKEIVRQRELARQKEIHLRRMVEEDRRKRLLQDQLSRRIASDYGSTRAREAGIPDMHRRPPGAVNYAYQRGNSSVMQEAMKFEAQMQLRDKAPQNFNQPRRQREPHPPPMDDGIIEKYDQLTTL